MLKHDQTDKTHITDNACALDLLEKDSLEKDLSE